ncbi:MAG: MiaB/RimO family radical SAM methylthiotransferase [Raoultibacter sp.]
MKFAVVNLGCKVNRVESDTIAAACLARNYGEVSPVDADVVFINTCTVTGEAEKKTRKAVHRVLRENTLARVVVTGCAAAIAPEVFLAMDKRVVVEPDKSKVISAVEDFDIARSDFSLLRVGQVFPTRVGVKVQDGCNNACTYCIVHVARGRATSRTLDDVVREVREYADVGTKEIVLTGINLGSYNCGGVRLADLLSTLLSATSKVRFRISSIEPRDVDDALIDLLAQSDGRVCRHLHLPLQAGSAKVLREMARPYTALDYETLVEKLYAALPMLSLSTDIIAGFPGETDSDFEETLALARRCRFSKIHTFPYSRRAGTPAAARLDQVDPLVKSARAVLLRQLGEELRAQEYSKRSGSIESVLIERHGMATTESYFEIAVSPDLTVGDLVSMRLP